MKTILLLGATIFSSVLGAHAQYFQERVLQKSYEEMDFFYRPTLINPFALGGFTGAAPGLINDPLLNLGLNPASTGGIAEDRDYLYVDFRSTRRTGEALPQYFPFWRGYYVDYRIWHYPFIYSRQQREVTPVISAAYLTRPVRNHAPSLMIGATYQLAYQDEPYYAIPLDVYRSTIGVDYAGRALASESDIPVVDRYRGDDEIHQSGHFVNGFVAYDLSKAARLGFRLGHTTFFRDGVHATLNAWEYSETGAQHSAWRRSEARDQEYSHWDLSGGIELRPTAGIELGVSAGWLTGDGVQQQVRRDSSAYRRTHTAGSYRFVRSHRANQAWDNTGETAYGSVHFRRMTPTGRTITALYQASWSQADLSVASVLSDTSYHTSAYESPNRWSAYESYSSFSDVREGSGKRNVEIHRFLLGMQWPIHKSLNLDMGLHFTARHSTTSTVEDVVARGRSFYDGAGTNHAWTRYSELDEVKSLHWDFDARQRTLQIPFYLQQRLSRYFDLLAGINRSMTYWRIDDVTLALFEFRQRIENSDVERNENFGERYTLPRERRTDVRTTFLIGTDVKPADVFSIRFLLSPELRNDAWGQTFDFQWWIGIRVHP